VCVARDEVGRLGQENDLQRRQQKERLLSMC